MKKTFTKIYTDRNLPFIELRYSNSNAHYKKHFHSTFSIGVNKEGISIYTNSDKEYTLDKNMISIMNPNAVHACNSCSEVLNEYYMLYLDKDWCKNIQKSINSEIAEFIHVNEHILEDKKFYECFLLQWLNPKAWIACVSGVSMFVSSNSAFVVFVIMYFVVCYLSLSLWGILGQKVTKFLNTPTRLKVFNIIMGGILIFSASSLIVIKII